MGLMRQTSHRARRAVLLSLVGLMLGAPCCDGDEPPPASQVKGLRILAVTADKPYAAPGDKVTFQMTYADAWSAEEGGPRPIQITWLGGCFNPKGDSFEACFPALQATLGGVLSGAIDPRGLANQVILGSEQSGVPGASSFELALPEDIFARAGTANNGTAYTTGYVFFIACAGQVRPAEVKPGEELTVPLECADDDGKVLSPDSFVVGYTQMYVFADGRTNQNPPIGGLTLDGVPIAEGEEGTPTVDRCPSGGGKGNGSNLRVGPSCLDSDGGPGCKTYKLAALVDDVAEVDVESNEPGKTDVREAIWVDYFADGGQFDVAKKLVSDTTTGYREDHETIWTPPREAGQATLWAVVHDARGGASVTRRIVHVQ